MKRLLPALQKHTKGFTLIELLVVVTIIAILSVIGIAVFGGVTTRARDQRKKADIDSIAKAFEATYNSEAGEYKLLTNSDFTAGVVPSSPDSNAYTCSIGPGFGTVECSTGSKTTFTICATLSDNTQHCRSAAQGSNVAPLPPPPAP